MENVKRWIYCGLLWLAGWLAVAQPPSAVMATPAGPLQPEYQNSYGYLGERLRTLVAEQDWGDGQLALLVEDAALPLRVVAINAQTPLRPAGLVQILTAAAALERLGGDFRFNTELTLAGRAQKETLAGDLIVRGDGDPSLSARFTKKPDTAYALFDRWAGMLRKKGVRIVQGGILADGRAFDNEWHGPAWPLERLGAEDLPSVGALNFNHNCIDIYWEKGRKSGLAEYTLFPELPKYVFFCE